MDCYELAKECGLKPPNYLRGREFLFWDVLERVDYDKLANEANSAVSKAIKAPDIRTQADALWTFRIVELVIRHAKYKAEGLQDHYITPEDVKKYVKL